MRWAAVPVRCAYVSRGAPVWFALSRVDQRPQGDGINADTAKVAARRSCPLIP